MPDQPTNTDQLRALSRHQPNEPCARLIGIAAAEIEWLRRELKDAYHASCGCIGGPAPFPGVSVEPEPPETRA